MVLLQKRIDFQVVLGSKYSRSTSSFFHALFQPMINYASVVFGTDFLGYFRVVGQVPFRMEGEQPCRPSESPWDSQCWMPRM